jgi:hypothetical protein
MGEHCNLSTLRRDGEYKLSVREAWFDGTEGSSFISRGWEEVRSQSISGWALDITSMQETPRGPGRCHSALNFVSEFRVQGMTRYPSDREERLSSLHQHLISEDSF